MKLAKYPLTNYFLLMLLLISIFTATHIRSQTYQEEQDIAVTSSDTRFTLSFNQYLYSGQKIDLKVVSHEGNFQIFVTLVKDGEQILKQAPATTGELSLELQQNGNIVIYTNATQNYRFNIQVKISGIPQYLQTPFLILSLITIIIFGLEYWIRQRDVQLSQQSSDTNQLKIGGLQDKFWNLYAYLHKQFSEALILPLLIPMILTLGYIRIDYAFINTIEVPVNQIIYSQGVEIWNYTALLTQITASFMILALPIISFRRMYYDRKTEFLHENTYVRSTGLSVVSEVFSKGFLLFTFPVLYFIELLYAQQKFVSRAQFISLAISIFLVALMVIITISVYNTVWLLFRRNQINLMAIPILIFWRMMQSSDSPLVLISMRLITATPDYAPDYVMMILIRIVLMLVSLIVYILFDHHTVSKL